jgi:hypothetical protein
MREDTAIGLKMTKGYITKGGHRYFTLRYFGDINAAFRHLRETKLN